MELKKKIDRFGIETTLIDGFDDCVLGMTEDERLIYSYNNIIIAIMEQGITNPTEAEEYFAYNFLNAIQSMPLEKKPPIICYDFL